MKGVEIKSFMTGELEEEEKARLINNFYELSQRNLKSITKEYIEERFKKYKIIVFLKKKENNEFVAFSFFHVWNTSVMFLKIPLFHYGFTIVDQSLRGQKISSLMGQATYNLLKKRKIINKFSIWFSGICFTSKCSTPVSFLNIKHASLNLIWPRIKNENELSYLTKTSLSVKWSRFLSQMMTGEQTDNYIIRNVNRDSGFSLKEGIYRFKSKKDKVIVEFFQKNVQPDNELITIYWFHPIFFILQKGVYKDGGC